MSETKQLLNRNQVSIEKTWDLTKIFKTDDAFNEAIDDVIKKSMR